MGIQQFEQQMRERMKEKRYLHTLGVKEVCIDLAQIYEVDTEKAAIAGILHDCAKPLSDSELLEECRRYQLPISVIEEQSPYLLHGKVGAVHAREIFGVEDEEICNAIRYHTTGRPGMSLLEKIVFTADYIEPTRKPIPRLDVIRNTAYQQIDDAVFLILENTLDYLKSTGTLIDTLTVQTYEYYKER